MTARQTSTPLRARLGRRLSGADNIATHTFLPDRLSGESVVVDLGANAGEFITTVAARYGARCYAVEANPALYEKLQRLGRPDVRFFNFAVSGDETPVSLQVSADDTASTITGNAVHDPQAAVTVPAKRLQVFLGEQNVGHVDLLKIDIEGAESAMFDALPDEWLNRIDQITIELHDAHGFMTTAACDRIIVRLRGAGFVGIKFSPNNTNWLFVRRPTVGPVREAYLRRVVRPVRGVLRRLGFRND